jgi:hypothetical protein
MIRLKGQAFIDLINAFKEKGICPMGCGDKFDYRICWDLPESISDIYMTTYHYSEKKLGDNGFKDIDLSNDMRAIFAYYYCYYKLYNIKPFNIADIFDWVEKGCVYTDEFVHNICLDKSIFETKITISVLPFVLCYDNASFLEKQEIIFYFDINDEKEYSSNYKKFKRMFIKKQKFYNFFNSFHEKIDIIKGANKCIELNENGLKALKEALQNLKMK